MQADRSINAPARRAAQNSQHVVGVERRLRTGRPSGHRTQRASSRFRTVNDSSVAAAAHSSNAVCNEPPDDTRVRQCQTTHTRRRARRTAAEFDDERQARRLDDAEKQNDVGMRLHLGHQLGLGNLRVAGRRSATLRRRRPEARTRAEAALSE